MKSRLFLLLIGFAAVPFALGVFALSSRPLPAADNSAPTNPARSSQMQALYAEKCSACHNLPNPDEKQMTREQWQRTVDTMLTKYKASDSIAPTEAAQIVNYLATFAPKSTPGHGAQISPWMTDDDDVWPVSPAQTKVFNFEQANPLEHTNTFSNGIAGPTALWRVIAESASPNGRTLKVSQANASAQRYALLDDAQDSGRDLDIRLRFKLMGGTPAGAVGIAFGLQNASTYDVLRYDQSTNDLALVHVTAKSFNTIQKTALAPGTSDAKLAADSPPNLTPAPGAWHMLRLLVKDGKIRGWIDMNKRINTQDPDYTGGKVGLWSQGATVAMFDDWIIDFYGQGQDGNGS